jgi:hypothetical protein
MVMTVRQAAKRLRRSPGTIHGWIRAGAPAVSRGRGRGQTTIVDVVALRAWWTQRRSPPTSRRCTGCDRTKASEEFPARLYSADGHRRPGSRCRSCEAERARRLRTKRKKR